MKLRSKLVSRLFFSLFSVFLAAGASAGILLVNTANDQDYVNGCVDLTASCSLRQALNVAVDHDEIHFAPNLIGQTILLTRGNFFVQKTLKIVGPGAGQLTIDANGQSGHFYYRVNEFSTESVLSGLTLTGGNGSFTLNNGFVTSGGGALYAEDSLLEIRDVEFVANSATNSPGGLELYNGRVRVVDSLIHQNSSQGCSGIGIDFYDQIHNSTIANNSGGRAAVCASFNLVLVNSTVTGNQTTGNVSAVDARRGVILSSTITNNNTTFTGPTQSVLLSSPASGETRIANSIIAGNTAASGDHQSCATYNGDVPVAYSMIGQNTTCGPLLNMGNILVADNNSLVGSLLAPLADNGGAVPTHAIVVTQNGNTLIDAGDPAGCADEEGMLLSKDSRGSRRAGATCDIGAYEVSNFPPQLDSPGDRTVVEGSTLTFQLSAIDPDGDGVAFNGVNLSATDDDDTLTAIGASLDPVTGVFTWTPGFDQAGNYEIEFTAVDDASPFGLDMVTVMITVGELNRPPVMADITPIEALVGESLVVTIASSDPDGDYVDLFWADLPAGASLGDGEDVFFWTPSASQVGTHTIEITGVDRGEPPLSATVTLTITVGAIATPAELLDLISEEVIALGLNKHDEKDLLKHASKASKHLSKGKTDKVIKELLKFIDEVQDKLDDGVLSAQQAADLSSLAQQAIDLLSDT